MNFIKLNGVTIHYSFIKSSNSSVADNTFVFINSLGTDFRIWNKVAEVLIGYGNILLHDKRGHGLSDEAPDTKGLEDYMHDLSALLKHLSITKCTLVGLSVGGMIAQLLAYNYPGIIIRLILCDTRHKIGNAQIWNERINAVKEHGLPMISEGVMERWFSKSFRISEVEKVTGYRNMLERTPAIGYIQTCEAIRDADLERIAKQIKIPTLCIAGSEDKSTTPAEVRNLADLIEGSKYEVIEGSGHIPCIDNPKELSRLIINFIK